MDTQSMKDSTALRWEFGLRLVLLFSTWALPTAVAAQDAAGQGIGVFSTLRGDWEGAGVLMGRDARFTMRWELVDGGMVRLSFTNAFAGGADTVVPVLSAHATYFVEGSTALGVWVDDRPQRLSVDGVIDDTAFVANWTAQEERGRTEYVVRSRDEVFVRDIVLSDGTERVFAEATYRRASPRLGPATAELRSLHEADQADRRHSAPPTPDVWAEITRRDVQRRERTIALLRSDSLEVAEDYYHAAMVLQHGQGSEDVLAAHILAIAAAYMGDDRGQWLSAAALDRYLHRTRAPQRLGTQYLRSGKDDPYQIDGAQPWSQGPYVDWLPDSIRQIFGVESRAEQAERVQALNKGSS